MVRGLLPAAIGFLAPVSQAFGDLLVELNATGLPTGPLVTWPNNGTLGGNFVREIDTPQITLTAGVKAVLLDGNNDWYVGPAAPASVTGNGARTIYAWVYNSSDSAEECVFSWSRRDGPAGSHMAFKHGNHPVYGAAAHWDSPDMAWNGQREMSQWTCIAYTYDPATSIARTYLNGSVVEARPLMPLKTHAVTTGGQPLPFVVGCETRPDGVRTNGQLPGSLSVARIQVHNRALTPAEIAQTYNSHAGQFSRPLASVPASIVSFTSASAATVRGNPVTLSWTVAGATGLSLSPGTALAPVSGSIAVTPLETTTYTLTANAATGSDTRTLTIHVSPGVPEVTDQVLTTTPGGALPISLSASDPNPPPGGFGWTVGSPQNGVISGTAPNLVYTPNPGFAGKDSFIYQANDGYADSNPGTIEILVNPPPTPPSSVTALTAVIPSSIPTNEFVTYLRSSDPNAAETHLYQLVSGEGDTHNSWFTIHGNQLLANHDFSGESGLISVRVRSTDSGGQMFEQILTFNIGPAVTPGVVIHELFYDPPDNARTEFIELHNASSSVVDLSGWSFTSGIAFTFPPGSVIAAGGHVVVAMDPAAFLLQFGFAAYGPYVGKLSSSGEVVELRDASGLLVDEVDYKAEFPWPISPSGSGASMELIHPSLDNNLGGSWRGSQPQQSYPEQTLITTAATDWKYWPGTSFPATNWRLSSFTPAAGWSTGQAPIGYGEVVGLPLNTVISGMQNSYVSLFCRKNFTIAPGELPSALLLRYSMDDGVIIWINGVEVARRNRDGIQQNPSITTTASAEATEGLWYDTPLTNVATYLVEGMNTIAVRVFNRTSGSTDLGIDLELIRPAGELVMQPTPAAVNTVSSATVPPQIRQVSHDPQQPESGEAITIRAKVTDPQGVDSVQLLYQIVAPGNFIPARFPRTVNEILANPKGERPLNPAFENPANWTTVAMRDDGAGGDDLAGDGVFAGVIPAQPHRTLVRYRISASDRGGASVRVPHADDPSLNFACFVYNGVPDYVASAASVDPAGAGKVWPKEMLESLPVYHWLIRPQDMQALRAVNASEQFPNNETDNVLAARRAEDWEGALVHDGIVYDHVGVRLRGGNSRYGDNEGRFTFGKRHYKFRFNDGHEFQARDEKGRPYPEKWKALALSKMFGNKGGNGWGMPEEIGTTLWSTFGVPSSNTHWLHFRVIDDAAEAPDQYNGDFWGLTMAVEEYDGSFLDARGITKGNLYKMSDWIWDAERQRRYQSPDMVRDGSEFNTIRDQLHGGQNATWLNEKVNYASWYRYSAVAEAIRHYDLFPYTDNIRHALKNLAWHFEPVGNDPTRGVCVFLPYDWDASFGPNWNNGWEHANNALYGWDMSTSDGMPYINKPEMKLEHRNVLREFRDLIWQPDQLNGLMDDRARVIEGFSMADQDRWRNAPQAAGTAVDDPLAFKVADMKAYAFTGWRATGGEGIGPTVGAGGRAAYLDQLADGPDAGFLPSKPSLTYTGDPAHPVHLISFQASSFSDPQGPGTFGAMAWRIGRVNGVGETPEDFLMEATPVWESGVMPAYQNSISVPYTALRPNETYRARVRMQDNTGRWSRWSEPYQFTATTPAELPELQANLMITEVLYNPVGPGFAGGSKEDFEFIELMNISGTVTLDLSQVRFTKGIDFDFANGLITTLPPGQRVLVVKNLAAFESRYGVGHPVAGVWDALDNLSNAGEQIKLSFGGGISIHDFIYDDVSPWPVAADGSGRSLVLIDPLGAPDHALATSWRASDLAVGSPGLPDSRFAAWMAARGAEDPDEVVAPGVSQLMHYALGGDLTGGAVMPTASFTAGDGEDRHFTLSFRVRLDANEVEYVVEKSGELSVWEDGTGVVEPVGAPIFHGDGTQTLSFRSVEPMSDNAAFLRLRVELNQGD